mmetsp:Transcript_13161/g.19916  ORF Transcript_13161/g.19916 Transcript_13161/m.19916 type:complete len:264 (+) Transcript_13161:311-1102(+)
MVHSLGRRLLCRVGGFSLGIRFGRACVARIIRLQLTVHARICSFNSRAQTIQTKTLARITERDVAHDNLDQGFARLFMPLRIVRGLLAPANLRVQQFHIVCPDLVLEALFLHLLEQVEAIIGLAHKLDGTKNVDASTRGTFVLGLLRQHQVAVVQNVVDLHQDSVFLDWMLDGPYFRLGFLRVRVETRQTSHASRSVTTRLLTLLLRVRLFLVRRLFRQLFALVVLLGGCLVELQALLRRWRYKRNISGSVFAAAHQRLHQTC